MKASLSIFLILSVSQQLFAGELMIQPLSGLTYSSEATDVSMNGDAVTGFVYQPRPDRPSNEYEGIFIWTATEGFKIISADIGIGYYPPVISDDGSTVAVPYYYNRFFTYTEAEGIEYGPQSTMGDILDISADGSVLVGNDYDTNRTQLMWPAKWSKEAGLELAPSLDIFSDNNKGRLVSPNGEFVLASYGSVRYFVWKSNGEMKEIPLGYASYHKKPQFFDLNDDGDVIGSKEDTDTGEMVVFLWDYDDESVTYTPCPEGYQPKAVSGDWTIFAGQLGRASNVNVWSPGIGMVDLFKLLSERNVDMPFGAFSEVIGLSEDGSVIVGNARVVDSNDFEPWVISGFDLEEHYDRSFEHEISYLQDFGYTYKLQTSFDLEVWKDIGEYSRGNNFVIDELVTSSMTGKLFYRILKKESFSPESIDKTLADYILGDGMLTSDGYYAFGEFRLTGVPGSGIVGVEGTYTWTVDETNYNEVVLYADITTIITERYGYSSPEWFQSELGVRMPTSESVSIVYTSLTSAKWVSTVTFTDGTKEIDETSNYSWGE